METRLDRRGLDHKSKEEIKMNIVTIGAESAASNVGSSGAARYEKVIVVNPPSPPGYVANRDSQGGYGQLYPVGATIPIALDIPYLLAYLAEHSVDVVALESQGLELDAARLSKAIANLAEECARKKALV